MKLPDGVESRSYGLGQTAANGFDHISVELIASDDFLGAIVSAVDGRKVTSVEQSESELEKLAEMCLRGAEWLRAARSERDTRFRERS